MKDLVPMGVVALIKSNDLEVENPATQMPVATISLALLLMLIKLWQPPKRRSLYIQNIL